MGWLSKERKTLAGNITVFAQLKGGWKTAPVTFYDRMRNNML